MGGNVFRDTDGQPATQRINQADIKPTIGWLEQLTGLDLDNNMLGSTGKRDTSGDLDLAVDSNRTTKEQLTQILTSWCRQNGYDPKDFVKRSGISVHFRSPIRSNPANGWVQVDFMFVQKPAFSKFALSAPANSKFKGLHRNILINSIAKSLGYKLNQNAGIMDRDSGELISDDPDQIAKMLINRGATRADLESVETIVDALANDPTRDAKLADAREHFKKEGIPFFESADPYIEYSDEPSFMARLRDRIVNQGMVPIFESDEAVQGGHAKGIEHFEDLVFRRGSAGIKQALGYIDELAVDTASNVSAKFDGKPAVIFGRSSDGQFVLTDTAGFTAVGYDGLFTSPRQLAKHMAQRDADATAKGKVGSRVQTLVPIYAQLWPLLEQSLPQNFRGYVQGDLLYTTTPPEERGNLVFTPNTITYRIPRDSKLGEEIADSTVGIAVHTRYEEPGAPKQPLSGVRFNPVDGLLLIQPIRPKENVQPQQTLPQTQTLRSLVSQQGRHIDLLFNPSELRNMQISDLPRLCIDYINTLVKNPSVSGFSTQTLLPGFIRWLQTKVTPRKFANIREYLQSPESNGDALAAAFSAFVLLHDIKMDLLQQLDRQHPGQEGWVIATPGGVTKFVNRFDFSRSNALKNNP